MSRFRRYRLLTVVVWGLTIFVASSHAEAQPKAGDIYLVPAMVEHGFPDTRLELDYDTGEPALLLAWSYSLQVVPLNSGEGDSLHSYLEVSGEYQLEPVDSNSRLLGALQGGLLTDATEHLLAGPSLELGAVTGTDGNGVMAGAAISVMEEPQYEDFGITFQLVYRHYILEEGQRGEFGLGVRFPHRPMYERRRAMSFWSELVALSALAPDIWWEFDGDLEDGGVTLALGPAYGLYVKDNFITTGSAGVEYRTQKHEVRGVVGTRAMWTPIAGHIGPLVEGGGVLGTDGAGGKLGGGVVLYNNDSQSGLSTISANYRRTWTTQKDRNSLTLDFQLALY